MLGSKKVKELSVIDGRRAQNCNILLSRLVYFCDMSPYSLKKTNKINSPTSVASEVLNYS